MFKKALQIDVTFGLLVGGYAGYARVFAIVVALLGDGPATTRRPPFPEIESKSARGRPSWPASRSAPGHWAARKDLKLLYYDAARGYLDVRPGLRAAQGRQADPIWPFAMIWVSKDGKSRKTATSDEAMIDLDQPFGLVQAGERAVARRPRQDRRGRPAPRRQGDPRRPRRRPPDRPADAASSTTRRPSRSPPTPTSSSRTAT